MPVELILLFLFLRVELVLLMETPKAQETVNLKYSES
jgi:hypothetical protein